MNEDYINELISEYAKYHHPDEEEIISALGPGFLTDRMTIAEKPNSLSSGFDAYLFSSIAGAILVIIGQEMVKDSYVGFKKHILSRIINWTTKDSKKIGIDDQDERLIQVLNELKLLLEKDEKNQI